MELIVFAFSVELSAENSNLSAVSGNQRNQLFGCMPEEQAKNSNRYITQPIKHKNKWWKIRTTNDGESGENHGLGSGEDFMTDKICSSEKRGSVGFAIDTTA